MHSHLPLNQARFDTTEKLSEELEIFCDAREESEQARNLGESFVAVGNLGGHAKPKGVKKDQCRDKHGKFFRQKWRNT